MTMANGKASGYSSEAHRPGGTTRKELLGVVTLSGALTVTDQYRDVLKLDPGGAHRDVTLDATTERPGRYFRFVNAADAAENLVKIGRAHV